MGTSGPADPALAATCHLGAISSRKVTVADSPGAARFGSTEPENLTGSNGGFVGPGGRSGARASSPVRAESAESATTNR